jgi:hypothetical protein
MMRIRDQDQPELTMPFVGIFGKAEAYMQPMEVPSALDRPNGVFCTGFLVDNWPQHTATKGLEEPVEAARCSSGRMTFVELTPAWTDSGWTARRR